MSPRAAGLLLFVGCVWGASFLFIRVAVDEVSPIQIVFFRSLAGSAVLSAIVLGGHLPLNLTRRNLGFAALLAAISTLAPFS